MNIDENFMTIALREAELARKEGNLPFGVIVIKNGKVIGKGHSTEIVDRDVTAHAETKAVSEACRQLESLNLDDCTMYASGEPCNMCASTIFQAKIKKVVIGSSRDDIPSVFRKRKNNH